MTPNKRFKQTSKRMHALRIPREPRREYLQTAFGCCFLLSQYYSILNEDLKQLIAQDASPKQAVKTIDASFNALDKYSEENYQHYHSDHPHHTF